MSDPAVAGRGGAFAASHARHWARNSASSGRVDEVHAGRMLNGGSRSTPRERPRADRVPRPCHGGDPAGSALPKPSRRLEADGLAIVPPERARRSTRVSSTGCSSVSSTSWSGATGVRPDPESGETHRNVFFPTLYYFLFEDPVFQEWLLNPVLLALVTYLLGESCVLTTTAVFMKGPADDSERELQLGLHTDQQMVPQPFPPYALICGATLLLTDYSKDDGRVRVRARQSQGGSPPRRVGRRRCRGSRRRPQGLARGPPRRALARVVPAYGTRVAGGHGLRVHASVHDPARGVPRGRPEGAVGTASAALRHADGPTRSRGEHRVGYPTSRRSSTPSPRSPWD